jgi:hypothetical protein
MGEEESDDVPPTLAPAALVVPLAPAENELGLAAFDGLGGYWCVWIIL